MSRTVPRSALLFALALGLLAVSAAQAAQAAKSNKTDGDQTTVSEASTCNISQQCWDGSTVSCSAQTRCALGSTIACTGTSYCVEGSDYVYCQGTGTLTCDECYPRRYCSIP